MIKIYRSIAGTGRTLSQNNIDFNFQNHPLKNFSRWKSTQKFQSMKVHLKISVGGSVEDKCYFSLVFATKFRAQRNKISERPQTVLELFKQKY